MYREVYFEGFDPVGYGPGCMQVRCPQAEFRWRELAGHPVPQSSRPAGASETFDIRTQDKTASQLKGGSWTSRGSGWQRVHATLQKQAIQDVTGGSRPGQDSDSRRHKDKTWDWPPFSSLTKGRGGGEQPWEKGDGVFRPKDADCLPGTAPTPQPHGNHADGLPGPCHPLSPNGPPGTCPGHAPVTSRDPGVCIGHLCSTSRGAGNRTNQAGVAPTRWVTG